MRGKLRDKRTETKRDILKRDIADRKRTNKRNVSAWLSQQLEEEEEEFLPLEDDNAEIEAEVTSVASAQNSAPAQQK